jgi:hypothetical protein
MTLWKRNLVARGAYVVSLLLLTACGDKDSESEDGFGTGNLVGTWDSACIATESGASEKKSIVFTNETFAYASTTFADDACATVDNAIDGAGTYKLNGTTAKEQVGTLINIDLVYASSTWTFVANPLQAVDFAGVCDATARDGAVDVLGKSCVLGDTTTTFNSPAYGTLTTEADTLLLSDLPGNGATAETRSTSGIVLGQKLGWKKRAAAAP